jgi:hypothetical protein
MGAGALCALAGKARLTGTKQAAKAMVKNLGPRGMECPKGGFFALIISAARGLRQFFALQQ